MKESEKQKTTYMSLHSNVVNTSEQIKSYIDKFDKQRDEITSYGKKFENAKHDIEQRKMEIQLLETQITNIKLSSAKMSGVEQEIEEGRSRLKKQLETLDRLQKALET